MQSVSLWKTVQNFSENFTLKKFFEKIIENCIKSAFSLPTT
jgi:hypothetical protein